MAALCITSYLYHGFPFGSKWVLSINYLAILAKLRYLGDFKPLGGGGGGTQHFFFLISRILAMAND